MDKPEFKLFTPPEEGERITLNSDGTPNVPDKPIIPYIEGDGIGPDIWRAAMPVFNAAVKKVFGDKKKVIWFKIEAGEVAGQKYGNVLPDEVFDIIRYYRVAIKGPLTTPVGGGYRSLNVTMRQKLDLYACVRPVRYFEGVPAPVKHPEWVDMIVFRENTEDVYAGIEWEKGTEEAKKVIEFLKKELGVTKIREDSGIGIKPISEFATKRLMRMAINWALKYNKPSVTIVHKGNIMKYTEGSFMKWAYEVAIQEFRDKIVTEAEVKEGKSAEGKIIIKDRITDAMFQQVLLRPKEYDVIITPNLNGDYLSDAIVAQVGGLGLAPGSNIGDGVALFEPTHGTAPKYAGLDKVNPGSLILSGAFMFQYLGWDEVKKVIEEGVAQTIKQGYVTYDLARLREDAHEVKCSEFGMKIVENIEKM